MLTTYESATKVYLACGNTDMRKSIDGLTAVVAAVYELDLFNDSFFVFCNKQRNKIKILRWDRNGFWLYYKRLEKGRFKWPEDKTEQTLAIDRRQLQWLLEGLTLEQKQAHKPVAARGVV